MVTFGNDHNVELEAQFKRYDTDEDGVLNEAEFCIMMLVHVQMVAIFNSVASDSFT